QTAPLWDERTGAAVDVPALLGAVGLPRAPVDTPVEPAVHSAPTGERATILPASTDERADVAVAEVCARLDLLGRRGDARLAGVLATLLHHADRSRLAPELVAPLGVALARRVADLVGLHVNLHRPFPDADRRAGLVRLTDAADLGVLHAVARSVLAGRDDGRATEAAEQVEWSALHAEEAGLLAEEPLEPLRAGLWRAVAGEGADVVDRRWAQTRQLHALGRVHTADEAVAATWRWRTGDFPRLVVTVGCSGSGKSSFVRTLAGVDTVVSLDELRQSRGSRSDQRANPELLREALRRLDAALTGRATVVWDATSLNRQQRSLVRAVADRRDALVTHAVLLVSEEQLVGRNAGREHAVPAEVLDAQLRRFHPPYPGEAHRTWYVGPDGLVGDTAGATVPSAGEG
ncbi:MAG TPA: ATP-binding protein, partial [Micromonospora sp.]